MRCKLKDGNIVHCDFFASKADYMKDLSKLSLSTDIVQIDLSTDLFYKLQSILQYKTHFIVDLLDDDEFSSFLKAVSLYDIEDLDFIKLLDTERESIKYEKELRLKALNDPKISLDDYFFDIFATDRYYFLSKNRTKVPCTLSPQDMDLEQKYTIVKDINTFQRNFRAFSNGLFDDFDWSNVVVSGSAVLSCLTVPDDVKTLEWFYCEKGHTRESIRREYWDEIRERYPDEELRNEKLVDSILDFNMLFKKSTEYKKVNPALDSDIDLYLYGLSEENAVGKLYETIIFFVKKISSRITTGQGHFWDKFKKWLKDPELYPLPYDTSYGIVVTRNKNAITINAGFPFRQIQIITQLFQRKGEFILAYDLDCIKSFYDGKTVFTTEQACRAIEHGYNSIYQDLFPSRKGRAKKYTERGYVSRYPGITLDKASELISSLSQSEEGSIYGVKKISFFDKALIDTYLTNFTNRQDFTFVIFPIHDYSQDSDETLVSRIDNVMNPEMFQNSLLIHSNAETDLLWDDSYFHENNFLRGLLGQVIEFDEGGNLTVIEMPDLNYDKIFITSLKELASFYQKMTSTEV